MNNVERVYARFIGSKRQHFLMCLRLFVAVLSPVISTSIPLVAQTAAPVVVSSVGYINGTSLTTHTSAPFNASGASTLVAFASTNTPWNGLPVSISGLSDNMGNTWNLLSGPTTFA